MIRVTCPGCGVKLNAKDELAGRTRRCPQCGAPVPIPKVETPAEPPPQGPAGVADAAPGEEAIGTPEATLRPVAVPQRLDPTSRYLICDSAKLVADWKANGRGWMLKTNAGLISAVRNPDQLPNQGDFKLVELGFKTTEDGVRLDGITSYQLAPRWALTHLDKGDHKILSAVTGPGGLNKTQKSAVHQVIMDQLMHEVWKDAQRVLDYLANTDYHSPGTS
jgi:hypothetical protein